MLIFCNGGCMDTSIGYENMLTDIASYGYVVLADNTQSGHGGTYEHPNGGANARMVRAWLDWQLKDKQENERLFIGGDLTGYDGFTIQHKNYK